MRRKIQIVSFWMMLGFCFAWLLTWCYTFVAPVLRPVLQIYDTSAVCCMLVFTVTSWWNTIKNTVKRTMRKVGFNV